MSVGGRPIQHGKWSSYTHHKCGCVECREAYRVYAKRRREGRAAPKLVSAVGSTRKLQALAVMGHPVSVVAAETGLHLYHLHGVCAGRFMFIQTSSAAKITAAYRLLTGVIPTGKRTAWVRNVAAKKGWVSAADWRNIDDPHESQDPPSEAVDDDPDEEIVRRIIAGIKTPARDADRIEAARRMADDEQSDTWIANRCGMAVRTVREILGREAA